MEMRPLYFKCTKYLEHDAVYYSAHINSGSGILITANQGALAYFIDCVTVSWHQRLRAPAQGHFIRPAVVVSDTTGVWEKLLFIQPRSIKMQPVVPVIYFLEICPKHG